jgi:glycosyltransferase involved in cell wall biosynthesis
MKILLVKSVIPAGKRMGSDIVSYNLLRLLSLDHEVSFLGMAHSPEEVRDAGRLGEFCEEVFIVPAPNKRSLFHRLYYKFLNLTKLIFLLRSQEVSYNSPSCLKRKLADVTDRGGYDLVIIEYWHCALLRSHVRGIATAVLLIHDAAFMRDRRRMLVENSCWKRAFMRIYFRLKRREELRSVECFKNVLALSAADIDHIRQEGGERTRGISFQKIPVSVAADLEESACYAVSEEIPNSLYFIGSLDWFNNLDAVLFFLERVYPHFKGMHDGLELYVVGNCGPRVHKRLQGLGPVRFAGFVRDTAEGLKKYRVCIAPIRVGSGIKIKILEAFILGKPVVTTSIGAEGISFFDDHADGVRDDPAAFAGEVIRLLSDDSYYNQVKDRQLKYARENLTVEANRKRIQDIIATLGVENGSVKIAVK